MSAFVQSLNRLFNQDKITIEKLNNLLLNGKITAAQYEEITGNSI
jgi:hypothetical protein